MAGAALGNAGRLFPAAPLHVTDAEIGSGRRSRFVPGLDVPDNVRLALLLTAALPDNRFEHPIGTPTVEHGPQLRSRVERILDVPQRVRLRFFLLCGLAG